MLLPTILMRDVQWNWKTLFCWLSLHLHLGMIALETHKSDSDAHLHGIAFCSKSRSLVQHIKRAAYQSNYWKRLYLPNSRTFQSSRLGMEEGVGNHCGPLFQKHYRHAMQGRHNKSCWYSFCRTTFITGRTSSTVDLCTTMKQERVNHLMSLMML